MCSSDLNTGNYQVPVGELERYVDFLQDKMGFSYEIGLKVYRVFSVVRYNSLRKLILQQLAVEKKYKIILYGENDIEMPGVFYGGYLIDSTELSKAIQCSKIVMQINPDASMNQRVVESLLSHTMVLVFWLSREADMSSIGQYLQEKEGFLYFKNKYELLELCDLFLYDEELRKSIVEKGYQRAKDELSSEAIFEKMMAQLQLKLEQKCAESDI